MTTRFRVLPYKQGSKSAKALAAALGGKVLRLEGSTFVSQPGDVVINWGNTKFPDFLYSDNYNCVPLNKMTNKKLFFETMQQYCPDVIPKFWTNQEEIPDEAFPIVCRTLLASHSGAGIVLSTSRSDLVLAPLYTQYIKKKDEYRVHLGHHTEADDISTIAIQRKAKRQDCQEVNWQIRNHANGFIYKRSDVNPPEAVLSAARRAFGASGLHFGAVDVIYNEAQERAYVLEINTAPGLEGQTIADYADFFRRVVEAE